MKKLIVLIGAFAIVSFNACGEAAKDVPSEVKTAFSKKFPDATKVKWDKENDAEWEAEFILKGVEYSANFDMAGTWMETEYAITAAEIPAAVKSSLDDEFTAFKIEHSVVSETPEGKIYEFELKKGKEETDVSIDMNGNVLKKAQSEEEEDEEGEEEEKEK